MSTLAGFVLRQSPPKYKLFSHYSILLLFKKKKKVENNVSIFLLEKNGIFRIVEEKINPQIPTP